MIVSSKKLKFDFDADIKSPNISKYSRDKKNKFDRIVDTAIVSEERQQKYHDFNFIRVLKVTE